MENPNLDNQNSTQPKKTNTLINEEEDYSKQKLQIISPKEEVEEKINKEEDEVEDEDDLDEDLIEDNLDQPGTIEKAKIHGNAKKILNIPKKIHTDKTINFCNDCFLPEETKGVIEKYDYSINPKELAKCGVGLYLFFIFQQYLIINLLGLFIFCSLPYIIICNIYASHLFKYCTEFYTEYTIENNMETNNKYCVNFINSDEYEYTSFDWMNKWSGETMLFYIKILKDFANQNQIDNVVCNFNFISFIAMIILFIINLLYVSLTSALKAEIDFNEQSPSDYTLLVSDIPVEKTDENELIEFLNQDNLKIKSINLTYNLYEISVLKNKIRNINKTLKKKDKDNDGFYEEGILCFKKQKSTSEFIEEKNKLHSQLKKLEEDYSQDTFNGVAFITFNYEEEANEYEKLYPRTFLLKFFINFHRRFLLCCCSCCLEENTKIKLNKTTKLTVDLSPEPEDIIFEHLEYNFLSRLVRTLVLFFFTILLIGVSFGIVVGLNYIQYKSEKNLENNIILKYGLSLAITAVTSLINFIMKTLFTKFGDYEKPWTYTYKYLSMSIKLTFFSFVNSAIIPLASNIIQYGWDTHEMLVNNMFMTFVVGAVVSPLMSITCYDLILNKIFKWFFVTRKYKDEKEELPLSQREINSYFEHPDMGVSSQYSNLSKQVLMTFFYMPIFPLGPGITLVGVILNYFIEKFKCIRIYKRPEKLNEQIAFFYIDYFVLCFFFWAIGNYIFFAEQFSNKFFELFNIIFYGVLIIIPYNTFLRDWDVSGGYSGINKISYDDAYLSFTIDYERLNPKTQKRGAFTYIDKLVSMDLLTKEMGDEAKEKINHINLQNLYFISMQTNLIQKVNEFQEKQDNNNENNNNVNENENLTVGGYKNEDDNNNEKETEIKNAEEAKFDLANNFLNNLGVMANKKGRRKKKIFNNKDLFNKKNLDNINPIFSAVYGEMAQNKYNQMFKLKTDKKDKKVKKGKKNGLVVEENYDKDINNNEELDDSSSI